MTFRKVLFWLHLVAGCVAGIIILIMSVTGVLLTYERQMLASADRGPVRIAAPPTGSRLSVDELVSAVKRERGKLAGATMLTLRSDPREPAEFRAGREGAIYVNPYTGQVLPPVATSGTRAFLEKMRAWHRWLGVEGEGRTVAKAITGACNLAFLFLALTGAYLWLPRRWAWQTVRPILTFRNEATGKARDFNWHNVFGIWTVVPLILIIAGALPISYTWANDLVYRITGTTPPPPPARQERPERSAPAVQADLNKLWTRAASQTPEWKSITARVEVGTEPVSFTIDTGDGGQPQKRSTLLLDPATADVVRWETFADLNSGRRLRMWTRFVHTGEYYGIIGQTVAGIASFAGLMLVWTGLSLALRRWAAWNGRRLRKRASGVEETASVGSTGDR